MFKKLAAVSALVAAAKAQKACTLTTETHPSLNWQTCTSSGCTTVQGSIVVDSNWRWTHTVSGSTNCYTGNQWDTTLCPNDTTCSANCCIDGADYANTYGITTSGSSLSLKFVTKGQYSTNIGSRTYLMADQNNYAMFNLLGNEFTFDVDVSNLPCGLNGALYFVAMQKDGGMSEYSGNQAGAKYGTGYCDSQCPRDIKFIAGQANVEGWQPSTNDANAGVGNMGACCAEMDIWEANKISTAYTPHPCKNNNYHTCSGDNCGGTYSTNRYAGDCDPDGCDFNSYRQGDTTFFGPGSGFKVDTTKTMTVVTQFIETSGKLSEIKRFYVQNGVVIPNSQSTISGVTGNSITQAYCDAQKTAFGDNNVFTPDGGLAQMGAALNSMVLVMSLWDDHYADMLWLDSTYPVGKTGPGAARGSCATSSGVPSDVEANSPGASVVYSNIRFGTLNSTFSAGTTSTGGSTSSTTTTSAGSSGTGAAHWAQCGGQGYTGPTTCVSPYTCTYVNAYYSQCL